MASPVLPAGSLIGLSYGGLHDTALAAVGPAGDLLYAVSLERLSRVKQDGRAPWPLVENLSGIDEAFFALAADQRFLAFDMLDAKLARPLVLYPRHLCHAYAAWAASGFEEGLAFVHDPGFEPYATYGGLFSFSRAKGMRLLQSFGASYGASLGALYSGITAWLGFVPGRHDGKILGLAASGRPQAALGALFDLLTADPSFAGLCCWQGRYEEAETARLSCAASTCEAIGKQIVSFPAEDVAATLQDYLEKHILRLLADLGDDASAPLCLAGGLFSNVKLNQCLMRHRRGALAVLPPMGEEGLAYGAALALWHEKNPSAVMAPQPPSMQVGPAFTEADIVCALQQQGLDYEILENPCVRIAERLAAGQMIALFDGAMEYGPRALGGRSILAPATDTAIHARLNEKLRRTEFMPFAPVLCAEDAAQCFESLNRAEQPTRYMTMTLPCKSYLKEKCPAVVHVDGTARPQIVSSKEQPFLHAILRNYHALSGAPALINTSFNIHEEPIVCSPFDACASFRQAGLDVLVLKARETVYWVEKGRA